MALRGPSSPHRSLELPNCLLKGKEWEDISKWGDWFVSRHPKNLVIDDEELRHEENVWASRVYWDVYEMFKRLPDLLLDREKEISKAGKSFIDVDLAYHIVENQFDSNLQDIFSRYKKSTNTLQEHPFIRAYYYSLGCLSYIKINFDFPESNALIYVLTYKERFPGLFKSLRKTCYKQIGKPLSPFVTPKGNIEPSHSIETFLTRTSFKKLIKWIEEDEKEVVDSMALLKGKDMMNVESVGTLHCLISNAMRLTNKISTIMKQKNRLQPKEINEQILNDSYGILIHGLGDSRQKRKGSHRRKVGVGLSDKDEGEKLSYAPFIDVMETLVTENVIEYIYNLYLKSLICTLESEPHSDPSKTLLKQLEELIGFISLFSAFKTFASSKDRNIERVCNTIVNVIKTCKESSKDVEDFNETPDIGYILFKLIQVTKKNNFNKGTERAEVEWTPLITQSVMKEVGKMGYTKFLDAERLANTVIRLTGKQTLGEQTDSTINEYLSVIKFFSSFTNEISKTMNKTFVTSLGKHPQTLRELRNLVRIVEEDTCLVKGNLLAVYPRHNNEVRAKIYETICFDEIDQVDFANRNISVILMNFSLARAFCASNRSNLFHGISTNCGVFDGILNTKTQDGVVCSDGCAGGNSYNINSLLKGCLPVNFDSRGSMSIVPQLGVFRGVISYGGRSVEVEGETCHMLLVLAMMKLMKEGFNHFSIKMLFSKSYINDRILFHSALMGMVLGSTPILRCAAVVPRQFLKEALFCGDTQLCLDLSTTTTTTSVKLERYPIDDTDRQLFEANGENDNDGGSDDASDKKQANTGFNDEGRLRTCIDAYVISKLKNVKMIPTAALIYITKEYLSSVSMLGCHTDPEVEIKSRVEELICRGYLERRGVSVLYVD